MSNQNVTYPAALRTAVRLVAGSLADLVAPRSCPVCGTYAVDGPGLCRSCRDACVREALVHTAEQPDLTAIIEVTVLLPYTPPVRRMVHELKYHGASSIGVFAGGILADKAIREFYISPDTLLVPIPLHPSRFAERGYNQSERIARGFADSLDFEVCEDIIVRTRATISQTGLDPEARGNNISGAFAFTGTEHLNGRPVILFDDVLTTGATADECASVLSDAGAGGIRLCVIARPEHGQG